MIIEDDPNMAHELAHLLEGWGYKNRVFVPFLKKLKTKQMLLLNVRYFTKYSAK